jgi:hypothetical protein
VEVIRRILHHLVVEIPRWAYEQAGAAGLFGGLAAAAIAGYFGASASGPKCHNESVDLSGRIITTPHKVCSVLGVSGFEPEWASMVQVVFTFAVAGAGLALAVGAVALIWPGRGE